MNFLNLLGTLYGFSQVVQQQVQDIAMASLESIGRQLQSISMWLAIVLAVSVFATAMIGTSFFYFIGIIVMFLILYANLSNDDFLWAVGGLAASDATISKFNKSINFSDLHMARTYLNVLRLMVLGGGALLLFLAFFGTETNPKLAFGIAFGCALLALANIPGLPSTTARYMSNFLMVGIAIMAGIMVFMTLFQPSTGKRLEKAVEQSFTPAKAVASTPLMNNQGRYSSVTIQPEEHIQVVNPNRLEEGLGEPMVEVRKQDQHGNFSPDSETGLIPASKLKVETVQQYQNHFGAGGATATATTSGSGGGEVPANQTQTGQVVRHNSTNFSGEELFFFWLDNGQEKALPPSLPAGDGYKRYLTLLPVHRVVVRDRQGNLIHSISYGDGDIKFIRKGGKISAVPM